MKFELAKEIVERFHDRRAAEAAHAEFIARFQKGQLPTDMRKVTIEVGPAKIKIANLLKEAGLGPEHDLSVPAIWIRARCVWMARKSATARE